MASLLPLQSKGDVKVCLRQVDICFYENSGSDQKNQLPFSRCCHRKLSETSLLQLTSVNIDDVNLTILFTKLTSAGCFVQMN